MGFQYLFVYKMQKSKKQNLLILILQTYQSDMKVYQFEMKTY